MDQKQAPWNAKWREVEREKKRQLAIAKEKLARTKPSEGHEEFYEAG